MNQLPVRMTEGWNYKDLERLRRRKEWKSLINWAKEQEWITYLEFTNSRNEDMAGLRAKAQVWDTLINFLLIEPDKSLNLEEEDND